MTVAQLDLERAGLERAHYLCDVCDRAIGRRGWVDARDGLILLSLCPACRNEHEHRTRSASAR